MRMRQCKRKRTGDRPVRDPDRRIRRGPLADDAIQHARRDPAGNGARGSSASPSSTARPSSGRMGFRRLRERALGRPAPCSAAASRPATSSSLVADNERFVELFWARGARRDRPRAARAAAAARAPAQAARGIGAVCERLGLRSTPPPSTASTRFAAREGDPADAARLRERLVVAGAPAARWRTWRPLRPAPDDLAFIQYSLGLHRRAEGRAADPPQRLREPRLDLRRGRLLRPRRHPELDAAVARHGPDRLSPQHARLRRRATRSCAPSCSRAGRCSGSTSRAG